MDTPPVRPQTERLARLEEEAGGCVLRTHGPTAGALAQSASNSLPGYTDHHRTEQHYGVLQDPVMVQSLWLKKPERLEAWGLLFLLALLRWRVMERARRTYVDTTRTPLTGWDQQATERPTSCMMVTQYAGVIVGKLGDHRQRARPLSVLQQQSLRARDVPAACFPDLKSGYGEGDDCGTPLTAPKAYPARVGRRSPAAAGADHEQPPGTGPRPAGR